MQSNRSANLKTLTNDRANDMPRRRRNQAVSLSTLTAPTISSSARKKLNKVKTVTREDIAAAIYESFEGVSRRGAKILVDSVIEEICAAIESGENVKLHGFGNFVLRDKPQRTGRNPRTMAPVAITERRVVSFKASSLFKTKVNHG
jgi:integration host factor subunit alpha